MCCSLCVSFPKPDRALWTSVSGFPCSAAHLAVKHVVTCSFSLPHACCVIFCCVQKPQLIRQKAELAPQVLLGVCLHMFGGTRAQISVGYMLTNCSWPLMKMNWWHSLPGAVYLFSFQLLPNALQHLPYLLIGSGVEWGNITAHRELDHNSAQLERKWRIPLSRLIQLQGDFVNDSSTSYE